MKTRSFIYCMLSGVALFTLSACADSVSEFFGLEGREHISFTATTDEKIEELTRAAINEDSYVTAFQNTQPKKPLVLSSSVTRRDTETTRGSRIGSAADLTAFRVSAAIGSRNISEDAFAALTPNFFYNLKAEQNANDVFEIERDYYWPTDNEKLWFYAYAPCDDSNVQISDQTQGGAQKVSFTVDTNVANQVDLMTANAETTSFSSASGNTSKTSVALSFRHELTAIRFVIGEQWLAGSIKSIGIYNVHGRGTMTIGASDASKWEWKNKAGNAVAATDDFVLTVDKAGLSGTAGEEIMEDPDLYFLMIPQSFADNDDAYIEVKYQDNAREYTLTAPLKGQSAWVRNTTVTYAISSHELTKLKIGSIQWPDESAQNAWSGPKTSFTAGDAVGLYVVNPDGQTIHEYYRNVRCSYDGESWTLHHPEDHPVYKLPGYQYFFYYPYTPTPDTTYPVAGQGTTNTAAADFFSHLINGWTPAAVQNTSLATLNTQDLQVAKAIDNVQVKSAVNATMTHQMSLAKLMLGTSNVTDTWVYPIDNGTYTWNYQPDSRGVTASSNFSGNMPYLHTDGYYYFVFAPVALMSDEGTVLTGSNALGTVTDWTWELKTMERGKLLTHTATSNQTGQNITHNNELTIGQIGALTATGSPLTVPVTVTVNSTTLTKGTDYTVSYKNSSNTTVTSISAAGNYTAYISPKGRYSGDAVPRAFTVNKSGKSISFANTNVEKTYGDAAFTQTVTNTGSGTVTYSSGNTNVATVNSSSGQVTIAGTGTAVITATVADNDYETYATKTATYTLTVNKANSSMSNGSGAVSFTSSQGANSQISRTITCTNCSVSGVSVASGSGFSVSHSGNTVTVTRTSTSAISGSITVTGTASNSNYNNPSSITISVSGEAAGPDSNSHAYVDLGNPSCYYATMNVGASSEGAWGSYFAWGETTTKSSYTSSNYTASSISTDLSISQDAARAQWGGAWRMPTKAELQWLIDNCTWTWTTSGGNNGYRVTSKISGYTSNSIFLPAAGLYDSSADYRGTNGYYWSSTYNSSSYAWNLNFNSSYKDMYYNYRYNGRSVRAVLSK